MYDVFLHQGTVDCTSTMSKYVGLKNETQLNL
jgi:hypothetical protein